MFATISKVGNRFPYRGHVRHSSYPFLSNATEKNHLVYYATTLVPSFVYRFSLQVKTNFETKLSRCNSLKRLVILLHRQFLWLTIVEITLSLLAIVGYRKMIHLHLHTKYARSCRSAVSAQCDCWSKALAFGT